MTNKNISLASFIKIFHKNFEHFSFVPTVDEQRDIFSYIYRKK